MVVLTNLIIAFSPMKALITLFLILFSFRGCEYMEKHFSGQAQYMDLREGMRFSCALIKNGITIY